jgi:hypothetical protein
MDSIRHLNKQDLVKKLKHIGVKTETEIAGLVIHQGLPANYLSPRKPYFLEAEIDAWLANRPKSLVQSNRNYQKILAKQRRKARKAKKPSSPAATAEGRAIAASTALTEIKVAKA